MTEVLRRHPEDGPRRAGLLELQATLTVAPCFCEEKLREQLAGYGMQLTFLETADVADFLEQAQVLATFEGPGSGRTYVMRFDGRDLIASALNNPVDPHEHSLSGVGADGGVCRISVQSISIPCKLHRGCD
ncbi:MAG: hypothetical protein ACLGIT_15080, partial [Gammaproteobacteria bacterium]